MRMAAAPTERTRHAQRLFAGLPGTYERMGWLLSFGQDPRWRRFLVSRVSVSQGERVLDVATGTAAVARELVARTGGAIVGLDQSEPMVRQGVRAVAARGLAGRIRFVLARAEQLPFEDGTFGAVTFTYLLRYVDDPAGTLRELTRVLRPGGSMAALEFHRPAPPWGVPWWIYTRAVMPVVGRLASPGWHEVGRFLGPSISGFVAEHPLAEQLAMWREAGVTDARARRMTLGAAVVIWGTKRAA